MRLRTALGVGVLTGLAATQTREHHRRTRYKPNRQGLLRLGPRSRARAAVHVLLGRPLVYRMRYLDGDIHLSRSRGALIMGCHFDHSPEAQERMNRQIHDMLSRLGQL